MINDCPKDCIISICDISPKRLGSFEKFMIGMTEILTVNGFQHIVVFRDEPIPEVELLLLEAGAKIEIIKPSKYNIFNVVKIYTLIKIYNPIIMHLHFYPIHTIVNYLKYICTTKIIYTGHMGGKTAKNRLHNNLRKIYYLINSILFDHGIEKIVCVSQFVRDNYFKQYCIKTKKSLVIYNGIDAKILEQSYNLDNIKQKLGLSNEFVVTCVSLRKDKGAYHLVKAAPQIIAQVRNVKFVLVGSGECENHIKSKIKELNIEDYFVFTGNVPDIYEIYSISSCVVMPSLFEEACPYTAIEAMSIGIPVIGYDSGGTKEVVVDGITGYIIKRDIDLLAQKVIDLFNYGNYSSMKEKSITIFKEKFTLHQCLDNYYSLYLSIM
ncbi:putative glycosyltransferase [Methanolobus psychrophilus R15]|nr:putative glycosyltransferase [Methanolobus psychrophilus R15]